MELLSSFDDLKEIELKMENQEIDPHERNITNPDSNSNKMDEEAPVQQMEEPQTVLPTDPYNTFEDFFDVSGETKPNGELPKDSLHTEQHKETHINDKSQRKMILESVEKVDAGNLEKRENIFRDYLKSLGFTEAKKGVNIDKDEASTIRETESNLHSDAITENSVVQEVKEERKKKKNKKYAELSEIYNFRKEKSAVHSGPYSLRAEIKGNKMLDFYTKITEESFSNVKAKTKDPTIIKNRREESDHKPEDL